MVLRLPQRVQRVYLALGMLHFRLGFDVVGFDVVGFAV